MYEQNTLNHMKECNVEFMYLNQNDYLCMCGFCKGNKYQNIINMKTILL